VAVMQSQDALRAPGSAAAAAAAAAAGYGLQGGGGQGFVGNQAGHLPETFKLLQLAGLAALGLGSGSVGSVDSTAASGAAGTTSGLSGGGGGGVSSSLASVGGSGLGLQGPSAAGSRLQLSQQLLASVEQVLRSLDIDGPQVGVGGWGSGVAQQLQQADVCAVMLFDACFPDLLTTYVDVSEHTAVGAHTSSLCVAVHVCLQ
jgi:hypothetical protein